LKYKTRRPTEKRLNQRNEITKYLKNHGIAGEDEIAQALRLHIIDVLDALFELEKNGKVRRVDEVLLLPRKLS
jgi:predicted Rossmann fold nucleotide-binding protein DprA/Smf involved in DNA uptake